MAGPNLTIDRTARIDALEAGGVLRTGPVAVTAGGKGVNVVRAARRLGARATLVGVVAGRIGQATAQLLADEGVDLVQVEVDGETRSTAILIEPGGRTTVINEPGPMIDADRWRNHRSAVIERLSGTSALVCSGSAPPGTPLDAYGDLVRAAQEREVLAVVDAGGPLLAAALEARAELVAPNLAEAEGVLEGGGPERVAVSDDAASRASQAAAELVARGARIAMVTAAAAGVAVAWRGGARWIAAPRVEVVNPIGAGDSFTAAAALRLAAGDEPVTAAAAAVAAGAAAVETALAGDLDAHRAASLLTGEKTSGGRGGASPFT
ncbi:MAG: PfkB family carbohydrate kinase [Egibacteraceae bacterium]